MSDVLPVRSDCCGLDEMFLAYVPGEAERARLELGPEWTRRWTATWRVSAGGRLVRNTHPFAMHGRIMARNGGFSEAARLEERLGPYARLVAGDTDSERYLALITQQAGAHGGDVGAGMRGQQPGQGG